MKEIIEKSKADEMYKAMREVPFGNSSFQNKHLTECQEGEARRYRFVLLQLNDKLKALKTAEFNQRRIILDIEELEKKIDNSSGINRERYKIDLEEKKWHLEIQEKLVEDAQIECLDFYSEYEKLPKFTRAEFEGGEKSYWRERFIGDAKRQFQSSKTISPEILKQLSKIGIQIGFNNITKSILFFESGKEVLLEEKYA